MVLKYHVSPSPVLMEDLLVKIYEAGSENPGQEVYEETLPQDGGGGRANPSTITANGLDLVVHIVRLYSAITNVLLHNYSAEPKIDGVTVFDPIYFKIGDGVALTPNAGTNIYTNPLLVGLNPNEYTVHRNNYGFLFPEGVNQHRINDSATGSFVLAGADKFNDNEEFIIQRSSKVVTNLFNEGVISKWFNGFLDINADTNYAGNPHLRKLMRFAGSVGYYFTPLSSVPVGYVFCFTNFGAGAANSISTVNFQNAPLLWNNATKGFIDLPLFTECGVVFDGANWNVVYISDSRWQSSSSAPLIGQFLGLGLVTIPDIATNADVNFLVTHNLGIVGDYGVMFSIQSNAAASLGIDNDLQISWVHSIGNKPNEFTMCIGDPFPGIQACKIFYMIFKR